MSNLGDKEGMLGPYRVLDLSDRRGFLCGKILGDLGADVIKVEPPGGEPSRNTGPYYQDDRDPEKSLYWYAFNTSKRGITLDLVSPQGRETLLRLVESANVVIESFAPGHMEGLGLEYSELRKTNPGIVMTSITPFGQTGPYRDLRTSDLVLMALGGLMYLGGEPDRPPVRITAPQAYLHGGAHGAVGTMIALRHSQSTGQGQHVDVSVHEAIARLSGVVYPYWSYKHSVVHRTGSWIRRNGERIRVVWPCRDGAVIFRLLGGGLGRLAKSLVEWMDEEGMAGNLMEVDWEALDLPSVGIKEMERWEELFGGFLLQHTKSELMEEALKRRLFIMPVQTPREVRVDRQLKARDFWVDVEHPELGRSLSYPGAPYKFQLAPWRISRRAPLIGEHNDEVFAELKAFSVKPRTGFKGHILARNPLEAPLGSMEGVKVADFGWFEAAPLATKYLADFGAQVIKVESGKRPDLLRVTHPFKDDTRGVNRSGIFQLSNSSKLSLALNLEDPRGIGVARRLAAWADVVVENSTPGRMKKIGLGYDDLTRINPEVVMISSSILGQSGPLSRHPGLGYHLSGLAGLNHVTGWADREGIWPHIPYPDYIGPLYTAVAILTSLDYRRRTGRGQHVDISQFETSLTFMSAPIMDFNANGREQVRQGNRSPAGAPHGAYPCLGSDRWCAISVFSEDDWRAFTRVIGEPGWAREPRFAGLQGRIENGEEMDTLISSWTLGRLAEEVMSSMQGAGVAAGVVQSIEDLLDKDPQLLHRGFFPILEHSEQGPCLHMRMPVRLSGTPDGIGPAPCLGEHTEYVCSEILGMSDDEFLQLLADGVLA